MSDTHINCPECSAKNLRTETICYRCGALLHPKEEVETKHLEEDTELEPKVKFGEHSPQQRVLLHIKDSNQSIEVELEEDLQVILGRPDPDTGELPQIDLTPYKALERGVSRRHARITFKSRKLKITDLGSANFTYLNNQKLVPNQARILRDGDEVRMGRLIFRVQFSA